MGKQKIEFKNCTNCLHCKRSKNSTGVIVYAFCDVMERKVEIDLEYWNKKNICKQFVDMRD
jgi:hypothetical protein